MFKKSLNPRLFGAIFILSSFCLADVIISAGLINAKLLEKTGNSASQTIPKTPAILTVEFDSYPVPLFFENDFVSYGINIISEYSYNEKLTQGPESPFMFNYPIFFNYYLEVRPDLFIGTGMSLGLAQITSRTTTYTLGQREGYHLFIRKLWQNRNFIELGFLTTSSLAIWEGDVSRYHLEGLFLKYGIIL